MFNNLTDCKQNLHMNTVKNKFRTSCRFEKKRFFNLWNV
ncbi:hypothetical protein Cabys_95 [Caldithrix abyssi DSM 13497]|uniref:Uncharacterized protein n=1 Tax=Caldithrix abyssi DSM 13497 TaxID=880073 RepID=A0A1J1C2R0_CALAY|nr:hypothetical protein Cabys_95 [Caldithrix abyssi DSM 13497]